MVKTNIRHHEFIGLLLVFIGATWVGYGIYATLLGALRILIANASLPAGKELLWIPIFYGLGAALFVLGQIELRELAPGGVKKVKKR
ncbi:MAG: hypothetical protein ACP5IJ_02745 [Candidatus Nanoarchaeia archaeon]